MNLVFLYLLSLFIFSPKAPVESISYPQNYFKSPLQGPLKLAGNFGEPRNGHFHTGLDFQTGQEEGHPVFAAADGYVSRINVSAVGYGNALYITHPNGYVTVYGHLREFAPKLMERLRKEQYAKKSFAVDIPLSPGAFIVKQGEEIARSGSTGSSGGPHLHFEIRDASEHPINPLLFGLQVKDEMPPVIGQLKLYPMDSLKYQCDGCRLKLVNKNNRYEVSGGLVKVNAASVGISLDTWDLMAKGGNRLGIYQLRMFVDEKPVYHYKMDKIAFTDTRYVLSQIDYPLFLDDGANYHRCYTEPGNRCPVYSEMEHRGIIDLTDEKIHYIKIESSDFSGNVSTVEFKLKYDRNSKLFKRKEIKYETRFDYDHENTFTGDGIEVKIPAACLFDTCLFSYSYALPTEKGIYSKIHNVGNINTQVFNWYQISIKTEKLGEELRDKAVIVFRDEKGVEFSRGGKYENGFITASARELGTCYVRIDTVPPLITPVNIKEGANMHKAGKIIFKISDELSGIAQFNTYLDGQWVLTGYDAKFASLTHTLDPQLKPGEHSFKVVVEDERRNISEYAVKFKF